MKIALLHYGQIHFIEIQRNGSEYLGESKGRAVVARVIKIVPQEIRLEIDGNEQPVLWAKRGKEIWLHFDGRSYYVEKQAGSAVADRAAASGERILRAPMPGQVRQVLAQDGQAVKAGETLILLEAMKMEIRIQAPGNGKVARVAVKQGQAVEKEQVLVELESGT